MNHKESQIQQACVNWFRYQHPKSLIAAIPNGGRRGKLEATILKREGVLAGFPDLIILHRGQVLFVELKAENGKLSEKQAEVLTWLENNDFHTEVCFGFNDFTAAVDKFIALVDEIIVKQVLSN